MTQQSNLSRPKVNRKPTTFFLCHVEQTPDGKETYTRLPMPGSLKNKTIRSNKDILNAIIKDTNAGDNTYAGKVLMLFRGGAPLSVNVETVKKVTIR